MLYNLNDLLNRQLYSMSDGTSLITKNALDLNHFAMTGQIREGGGQQFDPFFPGGSALWNDQTSGSTPISRLSDCRSGQSYLGPTFSGADGKEMPMLIAHRATEPNNTLDIRHFALTGEVRHIISSSPFIAPSSSNVSRSVPYSAPAPNVSKKVKDAAFNHGGIPLPSTTSERLGLLNLRHLTLVDDMRGMPSNDAGGGRNRKSRSNHRSARGSSFPTPMVANVAPAPAAKIIACTEMDEAMKGATVVVRRTRDGQVDTRVTYSRDFLAHAAGSPYTLLPPPNLPEMVQEVNEIVAPFPKRLNPESFFSSRSNVVSRLRSLLAMTKVTPESSTSAAAADAALHKVADGRVEKAGTSTDEAVKQKRKGKWVRYAMLLAYQGKNYYGMQVQKGDTPAIENIVLRCMHDLGYITAEELAQPYTFYFQRAARTDRAVSAVRQVCSMMLPSGQDFKESGVEKMNALLPADIRVMGIRRATKTFHAQKDCDSRSYSYTLPTFSFAKVDELSQADYRISPETIDEVNSILQSYVGTHNFFNYTSKKDHSDASCKRFIISFKCDDPFTYRDSETGKEHEFLTVNIRGQSFMLHQIRKMIGMTIAIARGLAYKSDIQRSFDGQRMDVPKAPGLGLLLEQVHYERYDKRWQKSHETLNSWGEEIEANIKKLKDDLIVKEILDTEITTHSMMNWLDGLPLHNFTVNPESEEKAPTSPIAMAAHTAKVEAEREAQETNTINEVTKSEDTVAAAPEIPSEPEKLEAKA